MALLALLLITSIPATAQGELNRAEEFAQVAREQGEVAALQWLRERAREDRLDLLVEIEALEEAVEGEDVFLIEVRTRVQPVDRGTIEDLRAIYPVYDRLDATGRAFLERDIPSLAAFATGVGRR